MKLETKLSDDIKHVFITENERALEKMMHGRHYAYNIPMHTANMRMLDKRPEDMNANQDSIRKTIIPELKIYLQNNEHNNLISRDSVEYRIAYNDVPYPIAHVYGASGFLCLGNIFVPSLISAYSPQQPLETLFLYNDRVLEHGNPQIPMDKNKLQQIANVLDANHLKLVSFDREDTEWVAHDTLWRIGNEILEMVDKDTAFSIMDNIFRIVFNQPDE